MADVFSQIYIHLVFSPARRQALILPHWEDKLYMYITGIVENRGHKLLAIGGMPDHIHIFIGLKPVEAISDLVREIKNASNVFIKNEDLSEHAFKWQNGYGVFSHSRSRVDVVCKYIRNQKQHHQKLKFKTEFTGMSKHIAVENSKKKNFDFFDLIRCV